METLLIHSGVAEFVLVSGDGLLPTGAQSITAPATAGRGASSTTITWSGGTRRVR